MRTQFRRPAYLLAFLLAIASFLLGACGGTKTKTVTVVHTQTNPVIAQQIAPAPLAGTQTPSSSQLAQTCPPGHSAMGCAIPPAPRQQSFSFLLPPTGPLFPDVYEGQGDVNWGAVKAWQHAHGWQPAGIFKMGEFRIDSKAARNAQQTSALGFWRSGYWFVRNTGCPHEADQITSAARSFSIHVISLDLEVPEARGYGACLSPILRARGFIVIEYTAPGTNPGGVDTSAPLWIATYGSGFACIWTCHPVAWQFTDGTFAATVFIPGIGRDDVNLDLGVTKLGAAPPPPDPYRFYPTAVVGFGKHGHDKASEYDTVKFYDQHHCRKNTCPNTHRHLGELAGRIWDVAHRHRPPAWTPNHRGLRFQGLWRRFNH